MIASRAARLLSRHSVLALLAILILAGLAAWIEGHRKPLWFDEIFSVIVATQPSWEKMKLAIPADGNPPLLAFFIRICMHIFGHGDFAIRLPSLIGFLGALVGVFVFIRRECGALFGLLAAVLLLSQPGWTYSFEARPYALLLGFMMLGLVSWQAAARASDLIPQRTRALACMGIFAAMAGSMLSHHIGVVETGFPLLLAEATRTWRRRRMDWPVAASGLLALPLLAWTFPMARRTDALLLTYQRNQVGHLTVHRVLVGWITAERGTLPLLVSVSLMLVFAAVLVLSWAPQRGDPPGAAEGAFTPGALSCALGAALLIPITAMVMMSSSGYYNCRYGIGSIAGIALLASLLLRKLSTQPSSIALGFIAVLVPSFAWTPVQDVRHPSNNPHFDPIDNDTSTLPIVVSDPFRYVPLWWYAPPSVRSRLVYLMDPQYAIQNQFIVVETALVAEEPVIPAHFASFEPFANTHSEFLLDQTGTVPPFSMKDRLEGRGFHLTPADPNLGPGVFYVAAPQTALGPAPPKTR